MSQILRIKAKMKDLAVVKKVAKAKGLKITKKGEQGFYSGTISGVGIHLPNWRYPLVVGENGEVSYDNYGGRWGNVKELNSFVRDYTAEKIKTEARKKGYSCTQKKNNNEIKLTIYVD